MLKFAVMYRHRFGGDHFERIAATSAAIFTDD